jgi:predicted transcriptional regulator
MASALPGGGVRHSILDLAPLELDCMNALWPAGEATVRDIQEALLPTRPRAYTTIMTILDRLAQKGIVLRRKSGRAWVYQPILTAHEARSQALAHLVDGFFGGSPEGLATHLAAQGEALPVKMAAPSASPASFEAQPTTNRPAPRPVHRLAEQRPPSRQEGTRSAREPEKLARSGLDTSLL